MKHEVYSVNDYYEPAKFFDTKEEALAEFETRTTKGTTVIRSEKVWNDYYDCYMYEAKEVIGRIDR